ncbi:hypothetical protein OESDEN_14870 [Oesophagostomum dentatum]|uniref:Uncharacterized protein n=1 Tax=Oesophagostomum dentatum TaxID=61180 RepID=A0A0B1SQA9_OESDE|nr:hypothetical protein OESDEN_14870 [Oesophagostomum dentatum]
MDKWDAPIGHYSNKLPLATQQHNDEWDHVIYLTVHISPRFEGPFPVIDVDLPNIAIKVGRRERTIHIDRTKRYQPTSEENLLKKEVQH